MLRRQNRLRREFVYKKSIEQRDQQIAQRKRTLKETLAAGGSSQLPDHMKREALKLHRHLDWDGAGGEDADPDLEQTSQDDEYRWAGVEDPKLVLTTSRDPSSKLKQFAKELRFLFPNCQRVNRGNYQTAELVKACKANAVTDLLLLSETRGVPDGLIVSHLPFGPTAFFSLHNVLMRHDMPGVGHQPQELPQLVLHGFGSKLALRLASILKHLFPVPRPDSRRVCAFAIVQHDYVSFRQYTYKTVSGQPELTEHGPRMELQLYRIVQGPLDEVDTAETEFVARPYMNTAKKRRLMAATTDEAAA